MTDLHAVHRVVRAVQRRERLAEATVLLTSLALPLGLLLTAAGLAAANRWSVAEPALAYLPWLGLAPAPLVLLWALLRERPLRQAARRLDAHYALHDVIGGALELVPAAAKNLSSGTDLDPRSADLIALLADDAAAALPGLDPRRVVPLPRPRGRDLLVGWVCALAVLAAMFVPPVPPTVTDSVDIAVDESAGTGSAARPSPDRSLAEPLREDLRQLRGGSDAAAKIAEQMLEVLDAIHPRRDRPRRRVRQASSSSSSSSPRPRPSSRPPRTPTPRSSPRACASSPRRSSRRPSPRPAGEALAEGERRARRAGPRRRRGGRRRRRGRHAVARAGHGRRREGPRQGRRREHRHRRRSSPRPSAA
jgi:hypothetical protein